MGKYIRKPTDYASAGNYVAAGKTWNGQPSRYPITDALLVAGATPDTPIPANLENAREAILFDNGTVQLHSALQAWRTVAPPVNGSNGNSQVIAVPINGVTQKSLFVLENDNTHSANTWISRSSDGLLWQAKAGVSPAYTGLIDAAPGIAGTILIIQDSASVQWSTDYGNTWTENSVGSTHSIAVHYGINRYWLAQRADIYVATTAAGLQSGTHPTIPIPGGGSFVTGTAEFADNNVGTICLVANASGGTAPTYPSVYCSTNLGTSWTKVFDLTGALLANIKYDTVNGLFITWDDTGSVSYSADGSTWTRGVAVTGNAGVGFVTGIHTFAIQGAAICKLWRTDTGSTHYVQGVMYSFDLGGSWFFSAAGALSTPLVQLKAANNRLYLIDGFTLWSSAPISTYDKDF